MTANKQAAPGARSAASGRHALIVQPRDPVILRDARPFTNDPGARAVTLPWPLPSTLAGALRTHIGNHAVPPLDWNTGGAETARRIVLRGPLLIERDQHAAEWATYVPSPADAVPWVEEGEDAATGDVTRTDRLIRLTPVPEARMGGSNLPHAGLRELAVDQDVKPKPGVTFWSWKDTLSWLASGSGMPFVFPERWRDQLPQATRTHVGIDPQTLTHRTGVLFSTTGVAFSDSPGLPTPTDADPARKQTETAMLCQVERPTDVDWRPQRAFIPLGGERRVSDLCSPEESGDGNLRWPAVDTDHIAAVAGASGLRLLIVTPAIFTHGWLPDWINASTLTGRPPLLQQTEITLRLVAAAIGRRVPVSGWDMQHPGPKPTIFAVPAGSVYFFAVESGDLTAEVLRKLWLQPVSDNEQHRDDGFGLVLPGRWDDPAIDNQNTHAGK